jgi:hypothetical protein
VARSHDRDYFYKLMSADTAKAVLKYSSLRWREPRQFNDPFDHQVSFVFPYTKQEFTEALFRAVERLVYGEEPKFVEETLLAKMILMLRGIRDRAPRAEILATLASGLTESEKQIDQYRSNMNSLITVDLNKSRVLCVTEQNDNVVMWSHYADSHMGVCLRLQCIPEVDNTLLAARKVEYTTEFPLFPTLDEHVRYYTGEAPIDFAKLLYDIPFMKHQDWSYEREWRVHVPHPVDAAGNGYDDWKEDPRVFGAMYLGCRVKPADAVELVGMAKLKYPHMEIYQAKSSAEKFALEFEKVA